MTIETILIDTEIDVLLDGVLVASGSSLSNYTIQSHVDRMRVATRAIEQAVLNSPEIRALRKDAERWRAANDHWRVIKVVVRPGARMHNASGIPWSHLAGQIDATIDAAMEQQT